MRPFFDVLAERARATGTLLVVGLDPHVEDLPEPTAVAARDHCLRLIEATAPVATAFKPNSAFFERFGAEGVGALAEVIAAIPAGVPVILDVKRGDIGSTARAYAAAAFDALGAHAVTVSPYLGEDGVAPFLARPERAAFVLCRTSNASAAELQDAPLALPGGRRPMVHERVADLVARWGRAHGNAGLVVGATDPEALARVRRRAPDLWILAPGVGAQGGDLPATLAAGRRADGLGLLVPVSRGISRAPDPGEAARRLAAATPVVSPQTGGLVGPGGRVAPPVVAGARVPPPSSPRRDLALALVDHGCVRFGTFTLKSGLESPIYLDLRRLVAFPALLAEVAQAYLALLADLRFDHLAPLPYAALPIGTAIALAGGRSLVYPRRERKDYGTRAAVEGVFERGDVACVVDDLATTGASKVEAVEVLAAAGLTVRDVVVLIDRESGAREDLAARGLAFHAVYTLRALLDLWRGTSRITAVDAERVAAFLSPEGP